MKRILDLRITLRYLGVPIRELSYIFGDNGSVVNSNMTSQEKIHKMHAVLSFYRVREDIEANIISYHFINGKINPADILIKNWARHCV